MAEPLKVVRDIIKTEMDLPDDRVLIYNQKWLLPNDDDIFVYIGFVSSNPISSKRFYETREDGYYSVQILTELQTLDLNIFSKNNTARLRKHELVMALNSHYAQQQCEREGIKILYLPENFIDVSEVEASSRLNRYKITFQIFCSNEKAKIVDYFDNFKDIEIHRNL